MQGFLRCLLAAVVLFGFSLCGSPVGTDTPDMPNMLDMVIMPDMLVDGGNEDGGGSVGNCAQGTCVATPPAAWQGPVAFYSGDSGMAAPACVGTALDLGEGQLFGPPAQCSSCTCSMPQVNCGATLITHAGMNCTLGTTAVSEDTSCQALLSSTGNTFFTAPPPTVSAGACAPLGGVKTLPPVTYKNVIRLCKTTSNGSCSAGFECFVPPTPAYQSKPCIYKMANVACDAPGFSVKHTAYGGITDTRDCSSCSCGAGSGTCTGNTELYSMLGCSTLIATVPSDNSCVSASGTQSFKLKLSKSGSCPPSGGTSTGNVSPNSPVTICCAP